MAALAEEAVKLVADAPLRSSLDAIAPSGAGRSSGVGISSVIIWGSFGLAGAELSRSASSRRFTITCRVATPFVPAIV